MSAGARTRSSYPNPLLGAHRYLRRGPVNAEGWSQLVAKDRDWERSYRGRWAHDRVVRSTHGVNCTGSCSWNVYVKEGLVTWESQAVDYPSTGPDMPDYEPRGCPRGASFSWYQYSPLRIKYPYVRGSLLEMFREARARLGDPVQAWAEIVSDPERSRRYRSERGRGGFVRASWEDAVEMIAAAHVHTIATWGPDRCVGFTPIPAMSMASYASGTRFLSLIGGVVLSFYDWYCDLPPSSPQTFGDQTDVPESGDWWNAGYLIIWGTNLPTTRTPDAHFMVEARYRGQKVVVVSPDYAEHVKFADHWLAAQPGTDGALAMAMGHVILKEHYVERQTPYFQDYARRFTDLPLLVTLRDSPLGPDGAEDGAGVFVPDRLLRACDLGGEAAAQENAEWKPVMLDAREGRPFVPSGSVGHRYGAGDEGRWNLRLEGAEPALTLYGDEERAESEVRYVAVDLPRFDLGGAGGATMRRGVPAMRVGGHLVTTVLDLALAQYGVARPGLPGQWPAGYDDPLPHTPAWQEQITSVKRGLVVRVAREFARNAELTEGRSMIAMGSGTNHWFHADQTYRTFLALVILCGCEGKNGGGWAHYTGQEKVRPLAGWQTVAFAADWLRPPRQQSGTPWFYLATGQWRYERYRPADLATPLARGLLDDLHIADVNALGARLGWLPSFPSFDRSPLELVDEAERAGRDPAAHVVEELRSGRLRFACEDPEAPQNLPRVMTVWRANVLGSSGKGHEYFLKHLLGAPETAVRAEETPTELRPRDVVWRDDPPPGKLDLLTTIDFRITSNVLFSDIVLPAATWYEKVDLSSTDLHPFVHTFNEAVPPPWEARTDWDAFAAIARRFSELAERHLGRRRDIVAAPLQHDFDDELAQPMGEVRDWRAGDCEPLPGKTMPKLIVLERDYPRTFERWRALGPLVEQAGTQVKGARWIAEQEVAELGARCGRIRGGVADGRPSLERVEHACEAILALSGTTNGRLAHAGFRSLEATTGLPLGDLAGPRADDRVDLADAQVQPRTVITSPEWSGTEAHGRRYAPFTINVEHDKPWHTLSGRMQLYVDHQWFLELGEALPAFRPPLDHRATFGDQRAGDGAPGHELTLRYVTPHSKWSIHSEYQDNLHMLTLFRGGGMLWVSREDAEALGISDNDWVEAYNRNGVIACRAAVTHRLPQGTCMMYHTKDRHLNVPLTELEGKRGGTDNSTTRIVMKPTHFVGGYAQLSWAFNYYGPTGSQRDEVVVLRKRSAPLRFE
ncbi:MAG TPA: nitrate reductase subunit alpha [Solirubrobacteraceae bacterium]|nr:nitrate reductase subunit alpha [Solirubrobacteraceae bacterium]